MPTQITPSVVREAVNTRLTDAEIEGAISTAEAIYETYLGGKSLITNMEIEIKKYLSAHYVALKDPSVSVLEEKLGQLSARFEPAAQSSKKGLGLRSTKFGREAINLDPTGTIRNLGGTPIWIKAI